MWDRTITICSAGKTFSVTGWKLGWAYGPANMMRNLFVAHQNALYTCVTPTQVSSFQTNVIKCLFSISLLLVGIGSRGPRVGNRVGKVEYRRKLFQIVAKTP